MSLILRFLLDFFSNINLLRRLVVFKQLFNSILFRYGFASAPQMVLTATPQVGDKEVSYSAISDWIAEKLKQEFQKVLVFPNMDDFYIPILNSELEYKSW